MLDSNIRAEATAENAENAEAFEEDLCDLCGLRGWFHDSLH